MAHKPSTVLLIEDNDADARLIGEALADVQDAGFVLTRADTLSGGLRRLADRAYSVVLLDLGLPDSQGMGTLTAVYTQAPDVPIVILTGLNDEAFAVRAVREGAQDYLVKEQMNGHLLVRSMRYAVERKRSEAEQARLASFPTLSPHPVVEVDTTGRVRYMNPSAMRLLPELLRDGRKHPFLTGLSSLVDQIRAEGKLSVVREVNVADAWFVQTISAVKGGSFIRIYAFDITERKRAEEKLRQSYRQVRKTLHETATAIALLCEVRDPYTAGHQRRMTRLACAIAACMGLSEDQVEGVQMAGFLHDIGKIAVPAEILSKPGKLTQHEYTIVKAHPTIGSDIIRKIELPWPVARAILEHHERMNGAGYPAGLNDGRILLEARILAVADVVEAMASHRPYRPAHTIEEALAEIRQNKGVLYDPPVVDTCLDLFTKNGFTLEGNGDFPTSQDKHSASGQPVQVETGCPAVAS